MTSSLHSITIDARDAYALSRWWTQVIGWEEDPNDPNLPEHTHNAILHPSGGVQMLFINGDDVKVVKNRVHFDIQPQDRTRDQEVERLLGIGASFVDDQRLPDGRGWVVLADPEGNEFCVERSLAERNQG